MTDQPPSPADDEKSTCVDRVPEVSRPPADVPGYETRRLLGRGAYGEVWTAVDRNTGRQVAIKFLAHRNIVDGALLSREVEKLVFLSADRYVVQLLEVGWDAEPPYYVMEYVENGSLDDHLRVSGPLPVAVAVEIFREVAVGMSHAHAKGVLHCDLKPANVLLDQDNRPRLADFGQSRLAGEQASALGTLFYMAPEQADLRAVPDAAWDVYALGSLLYCMLTGQPPFRSDELVSFVDAAPSLAGRLQRYRDSIREAPTPTEHRRVPRVDRALAEIVDRCIDRDTGRRFHHIASVLEALENRDRARALRPLWILGIIGPLVLLATMAVFGYRGYQHAIRESTDLAITRARSTNGFAARLVARTAAEEIDRRFRTVTAAAENSKLQQRINDLLAAQGMVSRLALLADPSADEAIRRPARRAFMDHPMRQPLQACIEQLLNDESQPPAASWFVTDAAGTHLAAAFRVEPESPVGRNFAWRTYFHGGFRDSDRAHRPDRAIDSVHLSATFQSTATGTYKVAVSAPVRQGDTLLGVLAMTVELGELVEFEDNQQQFDVLVDGRPGDYTGVILEHPLFDTVLQQQRQLPSRFIDYRVGDLEALQQQDEMLYADPLSQDPLGTDYRGQWIIGVSPVRLVRPTNNGEPDVNDTGLWAIVQERVGGVTSPVESLGQRMSHEGIAALAAVLAVSLGLWYFVGNMLRDARAVVGRYRGVDGAESTIHSRETLEQPQRARERG
jgi:hypothetical protein